MYELVSKAEHVTPRNEEVDVKHDHFNLLLREEASARVDDSFGDTEIELSKICDVTRRSKFKDPSLQLYAKFEVPTLAAEEVHATPLVAKSLYCQHHDDIDDEWSHIPEATFQTSDSLEYLTSDDPSGVEHDDVISSTDFIRITSTALKMAPNIGCPGCDIRHTQDTSIDDTAGGAGGRNT